ncbi:MAG TPA: acyltransferase family protein [Acidimicrobiales bacterium]|nr:acyltransferase family protein [Acidimicrobiales bacterium]
MTVTDRTSTPASPASSEPDARERPRRRGGGRRVAPLDGVRAVAVTAVLLVHGGVSWAGGGFLGVDVFFVLSGFLITSLLCSQFERTGGIRLGAFWAQRARRLLPALVVTLLGIAVYARVFASTTNLQSLRADAISTLLYVANWHFILSSQGYFAAGQQSPLLHTWSLAVEEQYYLIWPLVALFVLKRSGRRGMAVVAGVGALASAALMASLYSAGYSVDRLYYGTDTRAQALLVGSFLGATGIAPLRTAAGTAIEKVNASRHKLSRTRFVVGIGLFCTVVLLWCFHVFGGGPAFLFEGGFLLVALAAAGLIASVVIVPRSLLGRALSLSPVVFLGRISYGVYLYHWPLFLAINGAHTGLRGAELLAVRLATTLVVATASFIFLEEPIRTHRFLPRWRAGWAIAGASIVLVPTLLVSTVATAAPSVGTVARSALSGPLRSELQAAGAFGARPIRFMVVGDSIGLTLGMGLSYHSAAHFGVDVDDQASVGCDLDPNVLPFVDGVAGPYKRGCPDWQSAWPKLATARHADVVGIVLGRWEVADHFYRGAWRHVGQPLWDDHIEAELGQAVRSLSSRGVKVVLFTMPYVDPSQEAADGTPFSENDPRRADFYNNDVRAVVSRYPHAATLVDLNKLLDPDGSYEPTIDGIDMRWTDGIHISLDGGIWLQPRILPVVASLGLQARQARQGR